MGTFRWRKDTFEAIVRRKKNGVLIYSEQRGFQGPRAELLGRDWARRLEETIDKNGVPARKAAAESLGDVIRRHKAALGSIKPLTRTKASELERLAGEFGHAKIDALSVELFTDFAAARREGGASSSTVLHNLMTLRGVLVRQKLHDAAKVLKEAMTDLSKESVIGQGAARTRRPSDAELAKLDAYFKEQIDQPKQFIPMPQCMWLAIELPRRLGELTAMEWCDLKDNVVTLRDTKHPKKLRTEHVPVPPAAAKIIDALPRLDDRILPYESPSISSSWYRACKRLGIDDLHFHDLRREGVSRLFARGLSIPEVSLISGHLKWDMLQIYTALKPQDVLRKLA